MTFETFEKSMTLLKAWRVKYSKFNHEFPDSRDPEFREMFLEYKVVPQDVEKALICLAAWRLGHVDVYQGMSAVAKVIVNRQNLGMFRTHLTDQNQFYDMCDPNSFELDTYPSKEKDFEVLLDNIDEILNSKVVDLTQGATYFGIIDSDMDDWFREIVQTKTRTVKIGKKIFLR